MGPLAGPEFARRVQLRRAFNGQPVALQAGWLAGRPALRAAASLGGQNTAEWRLADGRAVHLPALGCNYSRRVETARSLAAAQLAAWPIRRVRPQAGARRPKSDKTFWQPEEGTFIIGRRQRRGEERSWRRECLIQLCLIGHLLAKPGGARRTGAGRGQLPLRRRRRAQCARTRLARRRRSGSKALSAPSRADLLRCRCRRRCNRSLARHSPPAPASERQRLGWPPVRLRPPLEQALIAPAARAEGAKRAKVQLGLEVAPSASARRRS